ncbi:MAG: phytanoyl-CoA dioxygenase family protein [Pseudomonadota bacterium]
MTLNADYDLDGFVTGIDVLPAEKTQYYSEKYQTFIDTYHSHSRFSDWTYYRSELLLKWVADLASEDSLLNVIETLIGPDILLWNAFLPAKPPHTDSHFAWHQDATYWPVEPTSEIVSAWIALSPVTLESGGMQMVRGSHRQGQQPHEATYDDSSMLRRGQRVTTEVDDSRICDIDLEPGQASVHHTLTLHRSGPNRSDHWRLGVGFNYASSNVGPLPGYEDSAMPLRGDVAGSKFHFNHPPKSDLDSDALRDYEASLQRQSKRYSDVNDSSAS